MMTKNTFGLTDLQLTRRAWLGFLGASVAAVALRAGPGRAAGSNVLRIVSPHNPTSMDAMTGRHGYDHMMLFPVYDTLVDIDFETLLPIPGLAESWSFADSTTLVMQLRQGITFHDGEPFNAEAVRFNLERGRSDPRSRVAIDLVLVEAVEVTGEYEVTIRLSSPDAVLLAVLSDRAGMMSSPKAIEAAGEDYDRQAVGTGPFKLTSWRDAERLVYERNSDYWKQDIPQVDGLEVTVIPDPNTGMRTLMGGQADFGFLFAPQQGRLAEGAGLNVVTGSTLASFHFYLNYSKAPLNNLNVRRALCHAVDREAFNNLTVAGLGVPTEQTVPASHWAYNPALDGSYAYDPERARELLREVGMEDSVEIELILPNTQPFQQKGEVLVDQFQQVGITLKLVPVPTNELGAKFMGEKQGHAALSIYSGRTDPNQFFSIMFDPASFINASDSWGAPELEDAVAASRSELDFETRKANVQEALRIINESALYVPLVLQPEVSVMTDEVEGYVPNLLGKPRFDTVSLG